MGFLIRVGLSPNQKDRNSHEKRVQLATEAYRVSACTVSRIQVGEGQLVLEASQPTAVFQR